MAFNAGAIVAKLKLDSKEYTNGIKSAKKQARGLQTELKKNQAAVKKQTANWKAGGMAAGKLGIAAGGAALAIAGLTRAAKRTFELVSAGAKIRDMEMAFDRLAKRAGTASKDVLASVRNITGALSQQEIIQSANMLELLGVGMENTARLTEIARAAGVALGKDVAFMLESIATGTARQSRLWLDNLGIIISVEEANRKYAQTLGKVASELTDTERRAGFLNAVLEKGDDIIAAVSGEAELASEKVGTLAANWSNLGDAMKKDISRVAESGPLKFLDMAIQSSEILIRNFGIIANLVPFLRYVGPGPPLSSLGPKGPPAQTEIPTQTRGGALARTAQARNAANAKLAAQLAADARKFFEDLLREARQRRPAPHTPIGVGTGVRTSATGKTAGFDPTLPRATIDWAEVADPLADVSDNMTEVNEGLQQGATLAGNFFSTLVSGAVTAGAGFEKVLMGAIGNVASGLGQMIQWGGRGMGALAGINPIAALVAGSALMGIAGIFRGRSSAGTPHIPSYQSVTPRTQEVEKEGRGVVIHVDNFHGDPAWLDGFMRKMNEHARQNGYAELFFNAP